jgi:hypothetical protein
MRIATMPSDGHIQIHFKHPPIIEAVIAVTVSELSEAVVPDLADARAKLGTLGFEVQLPKTKHEL